MKLNVIVKTGCDSSEIVSIENGICKVNLKSRPQDGKANLELIKLLSKEYKGQAKIISGFTSKRKLVSIEI